MSQRTKVMLTAAAVALIVAIVFGIAIVRDVQSQSSSPLDPGLKTTARHVLLALPQPEQQLSAEYGFTQAVQVYVHTVQSQLSAAPGASAAGRFEQVQVYDPSSMPPQSYFVKLPGHAAVSLPPDVVQKAETSKQSQYLTVSQNGTDLRVYVTPLRTPHPLSDQGVTAALEILQPESG